MTTQTQNKPEEIDDTSHPIEMFHHHNALLIKMTLANKLMKGAADDSRALRGFVSLPITLDDAQRLERTRHTSQDGSASLNEAKLCLE